MLVATADVIAVAASILLIILDMSEIGRYSWKLTVTTGGARLLIVCLEAVGAATGAHQILLHLW